VTKLSPTRRQEDPQQFGQIINLALPKTFARNRGRVGSDPGDGRDLGATSRIMSSYSDDGGGTWSVGVSVFTGTSADALTSPVAAFLPGVSDAASGMYLASRHGSATTRNIAVVRSIDGGATWSAPVDIARTACC